MKEEIDYDRYYDRLFSEVYDAAVMETETWRECYRAAIVFGRFLLSELDRKAALEKSGDVALARRGFVPSNSVFNKWLWHAIQELNDCRIPLPVEMMKALSRVLGCEYAKPGEVHMEDARERFEKLRIIWREVRNMDVPVRKTARELGVNQATISRWRAADPSTKDDFNLDEYAKLLEWTNVNQFRRDGEKKVIRRGNVL